MPHSDHPSAPDAARFRVEHREGGASRPLGELAGVPAHHATLAPFVSALLREDPDADGEVVLVEVASQRVVARRRVRQCAARGRTAEAAQEDGPVDLAP